MRIIKLLPGERELAILNKAGVEPEVEGTIFIVSWHIAGIGLEEHLGVSSQHRTVGGLDSQHISRAVVVRYAINL